MTYQQSLDNLAPLQAALTAAQSTVAAIQPLVDAAQANVNAFRKFIVDWTPSGDTQYNNLELPSDAQANGDQAFVIRDSMPDPVPCQVQHYDTSALTWGDPVPGVIGFYDGGTP